MVTDEKRSRETDYQLVDSISVAAFDVDARIFRTLWHSIVRTPKVALAAIQGDYSRYISPIRVLVALLGLQFAAAAIFGAPTSVTIESLSANMDPARLVDWLNGHDAASIDRAIEDSMSLMLWPIMIVSSLPYLILLKLYRPSLTLWTHLCLYLVPTNASTLIFILMLPAVLFAESMVGIALMAMLAAYFILTGWLIARFYSRSILGTVMRIGGLILLSPLTFIISAASQFLAASWILDNQFGLSLLDLFQP